MSKSSGRSLSLQSLGEQRTFKVMSVMSRSSRVCLRSLSENKGPSKSCPSLQTGVCLYSLLENKGRSKSCQSCPSFQGSVSAVSRRAKDLQSHDSHVQVFRPEPVSTVSWIAKDHQSHVQVFRPESISTVSQRTKDLQSYQSCPSLQGSVSAVSRTAKDLQSHVSHAQAFRALSPQSLGQRRTFKVMSAMSKSSRVCLRSLSESKSHVSHVQVFKDLSP